MAALAQRELPTSDPVHGISLGLEQRTEHWAAIASLIETCKLNGVDPIATRPTSCPALSKATRKAASTSSSTN